MYAIQMLNDLRTAGARMKPVNFEQLISGEVLDEIAPFDKFYLILGPKALEHMYDLLRYFRFS
jgi:hypothetical protein